MDQLPLSFRRASELNGSDYGLLRQKAITYIQHLAGQHWTDHNAHDPGVTILEQYCYALTDLCYRAGFPIADLLSEGGRESWPQTYSPRQMHSTGPFTLLDWRKLLLDIPGVANVRILPVDTALADHQPQAYYDRLEDALSLSSLGASIYFTPLNIQGLYHIDYVLEKVGDPTAETVNEQTVSAAIWACFQARRNLCEDLYEVRRLVELPIKVKAHLEIGPVSHPEALLAEVYGRIRLYCSPFIRFYSLQEQLAKGYTLDEIMDGPVLEHGYLEEEEVQDLQIRHSLRISDLIRLIMAVEGVQAVRWLSLEDQDDKILAATHPGYAWEWLVPKGRVAGLESIHDPGNAQIPDIELWRQGSKVPADWTETRQLIRQRMAAEDPHEQTLQELQLDQLLPPGRNRELGKYQSLLHQMPDLYGVGRQGLPKESTSRRQAQARQLKAFLSFFDQILANEFAQVAGIRSFFDLDLPKPDKTYFTSSIIGEAPGIEEVLDDSTTPTTDDPTDRQRKKRLIHHLLARFSERFTDFWEPEAAPSLSDEVAFLHDYAQLGYKRFKAFNYTAPSWETGNVSGLKERLYRLLGMETARSVPLANMPPENRAGGFHLVEHILLRPSLGDENQLSPILLLPFNGDENRPPLKDPYSLQLSFVLPAWLQRFQEENFRPFLIRTLREQCPGHLRFYLHWLDQEQMKAFESAYQVWLQQIQ